MAKFKRVRVIGDHPHNYTPEVDYFRTRFDAMQFIYKKSGNSKSLGEPRADMTTDEVEDWFTTLDERGQDIFGYSGAYSVEDEIIDTDDYEPA
jgi:hypothetical protein